MIPRTLWCLWFQGWQSAPEIVKVCIASWRYKNPNWDIKLLSRENIEQYIDQDKDVLDIYKRGGTPQELSDLIRISLLSRHGGVWVDATVYCLRPLDEWLWYAVPLGFFGFSKPVSGYMIASWFLASGRDNYISNVWRNNSVLYQKETDVREEYFWFHRIFGDIYRKDAKFKEMWDDIPKIHANIPHIFAPYDKRLPENPSQNDILVVEAALTPVLKLNHRFNFSDMGSGKHLSVALPTNSCGFVAVGISGDD